MPKPEPHPAKAMAWPHIALGEGIVLEPVAGGSLVGAGSFFCFACPVFPARLAAAELSLPSDRAAAGSLRRASSRDCFVAESRGWQPTIPTRLSMPARKTTAFSMRNRFEEIPVPTGGKSICDTFESFRPAIGVETSPARRNAPCAHGRRNSRSFSGLGSEKS